MLTRLELLSTRSRNPAAASSRTAAIAAGYLSRNNRDAEDAEGEAVSAEREGGSGVGCVCDSRPLPVVEHPELVQQQRLYPDLPQP